MQRSVRRATRLVGGIDPVLMVAFLGLMCIGVLMVYSASIHDAYTYYGSAYYVVEREIVWAGLGFVALGVAARVSYHRWQQFSLPFFVLSVLLLVMVLTPHIGHASKGARRWISLSSSITLEPSELVKLALVVYLAAWLASKGERVRDFKASFVPFGVMVGLIALMIVLQPDLGTTIVVAATAFTMFYIAGADSVHLVLAGSGGVAFAWLFAHNSSYRYGRLMAFTDPWKDPTGTGYHTIQALLALGTGGIVGRGFGNSIQKNWLPAPHTDSILAVIGEEWGLVGTLVVLALFMIIAYRGMRIALAAPDKFSRYLAAGITSWIMIQALLNFAVITSSVPFTGVPLPFVSYGGTSLTISMTAIGILLSISRHTTGDVLARQGTHNGRGDGRPRVPRAIDHPLPAAAGRETGHGQRGGDGRGTPPSRVRKPRNRPQRSGVTSSGAR
ncbi:MAG TPA: putative lipid II flippase FtsW [Chloroflexota bacterium]